MRCDHTVILFLLSLLSSIAHGTPCIGADWAQFLGPDRNGVSRETTPLIDDFPVGGPKIAWKAPGGVGMSGIAVAGEFCFTLANRDGKQVLLALDRATGTARWSTALAPEYKNSMGDGPRATPTVRKDRIYAFTGEGVLSCHELLSGKTIWQRNLPEDLNSKPSEYGMSSSPLLVDDMVVVQVGADQAAVVAADVATGKTVWTAGQGRAGYSSPALLQINGQSQIVAFTGSECIGLEPNSGKLLWKYPFITEYDCNTASPVTIDGQVLISAGENHGSALLQVASQGDVTEVWQSQGTGSALRSEWQTPLVAGKVIFGFDNVGSAGPVTNLTCLDAPTGKVLWKQMRFGKSNGILADGKLLISTMDGELVLVRATGEKFLELARAKVLGKTRQAPALSGGFAFLRDDEDVICIDLRKP